MQSGKPDEAKDFLVKASFQDDAFQDKPDFMAGGYKPMRVGTFKGSYLHVSITASTTAEFEVKVIFLKKLEQIKKQKRPQEDENIENRNWTRKTALEEVSRVIGAKHMEELWLSKMESLKGQRKTNDIGSKLKTRTKQIKA
jgi:hypothetical protein